MRKQRGLSLVSVLIVGAVLAFVLLVGFRSVPVFTEYMAIERTLKAMAEEGDRGANASQMRSTFIKRAEVEEISSVRSADILISRPGGTYLVEVSYSRTVPLVANVSLLFEFDVSSSDTP